MKFKVTQQSSQDDCGAACVCMVLNNYFQKKISLCEIRPIIKNTTNGTSFGDVKIGLERFGIKATIFKSEKEFDAFSEMSFPVITQIDNNNGTYHYVVVYKCTKTHIYYGDPNFTSTKKVKYQKFIANWIPYIIQVDTNYANIKIEVEDSLNKLSYFSLFFHIKGKVMLVVGFSILIYILGIIGTTMFNAYFNVLIPSKFSSLIFYVMVLYLLISLAKFGLTYLTTAMINSLSKTLDTILSKEFFSALFNKSTSALEYFGVGDTIASLSNIVLIRQRFFACAVSLPLNCIWIIVSFVLLFRTNKYLSVLVLFLIILLFLIIIYANDSYQTLSRQVLDSNKSLNEDMIDIFSNVTMIKEYQQESEFIDRGLDKLLDNINSRNKLFNFDAKLTGIKQTILEMFNILLFSIGTLLIINDNFTTGVLLTYNSIIGFAINPLMNLANIQSLLSQGKAAQDILLSFLNSKLCLFGKEKFPDITNELLLEIDKLNFSFDSRNSLLKNINLRSDCANSIAIVGINGSGKTTLGKLLARYYIPDSGQIKINGLDINRISEEEFCRHVVFIDSNEELISSSIIDNILLGRDSKLEKLNSILRDLSLDELTNNLENSYNTKVGNRGVKLSLGQKQIIKIARATYEEKGIYIFDEVMNGLDDLHKKMVFEYLIKLPGLKIFITHDYQIYNFCDKILNV